MDSPLKERSKSLKEDIPQSLGASASRKGNSSSAIKNQNNLKPRLSELSVLNPLGNATIRSGDKSIRSPVKGQKIKKPEIIVESIKKLRVHEIIAEHHDEASFFI